MAKQQSENNNVLANPEELKKFKQFLVTITHYMQIADDQKTAIAETVTEASTTFGIDKKIIRKLASTMFKHNYADIQEENSHFEILYESLIGAKISSIDPTDPDIE